jgi:hypothetical protein
MGGFKFPDVLEKTGVQKGKFLLALFFFKEKYAPLVARNISF